MTTATILVLTITGTLAGADSIELDCDHGTTGALLLVSVEDGTNLPEVIERASARHVEVTGCSCEWMVAVLDGHEDGPVH